MNQTNQAPTVLTGGPEDTMNAVQNDSQRIVSATPQKKSEYDLRVQAVVETSLAYYRRGETQQYDSITLNNAIDSRHMDGGIGTHRATDNVSPEDATYDSVSYLVCSTFTYNVYYEAIGFKIGGSELRASCKKMLANCNDYSVYHYYENCGETIEEAVETAKRVLRPGDVVVGVKDTKNSTAGHAMMYLGDCLDDGHNYVAHSWGGKYNLDTGIERHEDNGTVVLQDAFDCLFNPKVKKGPRWCLYNMNEFSILRPLCIAREENYPLTPNARARLAHPGLNIDRRANVTPYNTIAPGSNITYTITVENKSLNNYEALPVEELVPEGTALVEAESAAVNGRTLQWLLDIPAGESRTVRYTVSTGADTGATVVSEGGNVAGIRSNRIVTHLGNVLTAEQSGRLVAIAQTADAAPGLEFIRNAYSQIGMELALPKVKELIFGMYESITHPSATGPIIRRKVPAEEFAAAVTMQVPRYQGGRTLITGSAAERILEFDLRYLQTGDILLYVQKPLTEEQSEEAYLYLGEGAFAFCQDDKIVVTTEELLWRAFAKDLFLLLRPSLNNA